MLYTPKTITPVCVKLHKEGKTIVLTTGFFDLLHQEHRNFLHKAKSQGDILIVGVESDARARAVKGEGRPIEPQSLRADHLSRYADYTLLLPDDFSSSPAHDYLLRIVKPNVFAVSSHTAHLPEKRRLTEKYGGKLVVVHEFNPSISSTKIIQEMRAPHQNSNGDMAE